MNFCLMIVINLVAWAPLTLSRKFKENAWSYILLAFFVIVPALFVAIAIVINLGFWYWESFFLNVLVTYVMSVKRGYYPKEIHPNNMV